MESSSQWNCSQPPGLTFPRLSVAGPLTYLLFLIWTLCGPLPGPFPYASPQCGTALTLVSLAFVYAWDLCLANSFFGTNFPTLDISLPPMPSLLGFLSCSALPAFSIITGLELFLLASSLLSNESLAEEAGDYFMSPESS